MIEREQAILIANRWLDTPPDMTGDPDCDECILARQFLRLLESQQLEEPPYINTWLCTNCGGRHSVFVSACPKHLEKPEKK